MSSKDIKLLEKLGTNFDRTGQESYQNREKEVTDVSGLHCSRRCCRKVVDSLLRVCRKRKHRNKENCFAIGCLSLKEDVQGY